jgi:hypothetical protein
MRGSTGHQRYHEWLMQETRYAISITTDWNQYLLDQYNWLARTYPNECEGFCIFALNADWDIPEGHDMSQARNDGFRALLTVQTQEPIPMPEPVIFDPPLYPKKVSVASGVWNLRAAMAANNAVTVYGQLTTEWQTMNVSVVTNPANGYEWYKYEQNGTVGYFADTDRLRWASVDTPTPPETDDEFIKALKERVDAQDIVIDSLVKTIANFLEDYDIDKIKEDVAALKQVNEMVTLDIPAGDFTIQVARHELQTKGDTWEGLSRFYHSLYKQAYRAAGILLVEDVDADTFGVHIGDDVFSNFSNLPEDDMLTDEIMNGEDKLAS